MFATLLGVVLLALAALILARRLMAFVRTKGHSACEHCPYAKGCSGSCQDKT